MPRGPTSSASVLATIASPGRRPLEMVRLGIGERTDDDSTNVTEPPSPSSSTTPRATRTAPRNTDSKARTQSSSFVVATEPVGGPPTETSTPSRRPKLSRAAATSRAGVPASALSAVTDTAASPSSATAAARLSSLRPESTTLAPSATSCSAVARPSPRAPPVTM